MVKSRFIPNKNGFYILDRKPYPGRYYISKENIFTKGNMTFVPLSNLKHHWTNKIRFYIRDNIFYNTSKKERPIVLAIVLGEKIPDSWKFVYNLGISHYLAVSGLHILIISAFILKILGDTIFSNVIVATLLLIYSLVIFTPSVIRAFIFFMFSIFARLLGEEKDKKKEFFWALIVCLIIFKNSISLHLTFIATSTFLIFNNLNFWQLSLIMPIITAIPSLYFFNKINLLSFIPNIILSIPLTLLIACSFISIFINVSYINQILVYIIESISKILLKTSIIVNIKINILILIIYYLIILYFILKKRRY